jgi:hypothetical protein
VFVQDLLAGAPGLTPGLTRVAFDPLPIVVIVLTVVAIAFLPLHDTDTAHPRLWRVGDLPPGRYDAGLIFARRLMLMLLCCPSLE